MTLDIYAAEIIERFKNPHNFGKLSQPDFEAREDNPLCGDELILQIKSTEKGLSAKFSGKGCAISQASADFLCDYIGKIDKSELSKIDDKKLLELMHVQIKGARLKCALLPLVALKKAINF